MTTNNSIAFQGVKGAYSDLAARILFPTRPTLPCAVFEDVFEAVRESHAEIGIIPIDNSIVGRVADIHHLLPGSGLFIVGEHFELIRHCLMALPGSKLSDLKTVLSHPQALSQCRVRLRSLKLAPETFSNTAAAAAEIMRRGDRSVAAVGSKLAAQLNGLDVLLPDLQDEAHNTTRFLVMAREAREPPPDVPAMTTLIFRVRNVPAALYKALGGFATAGVNMVKLESYSLDGSFLATQFYCDVEGRPQDGGMILALDELSFFASEIRLLGTYPAHKFRQTLDAEHGT